MVTVSTKPMLWRKTAAAQALGVCNDKIEDLIREGRLAAVRVGRLTQIPDESLRAYIASLQPVRMARQRKDAAA
jgi:excisionase family DNA binding protein